MSGGAVPEKIEVPGGGNDLASLLLYAIELGASDIHLSIGEPPLYRLHGAITQTNLPRLDRDALHRLLYDMLDDDQRRRFERDKELDFALQLGAAGRFRVNCLYTMRGEGAVFRIIPTIIKSFEELNLPPVLRAVAEKPRGLVLVTGPTGSGKSTTLAAMIDYINNTRDEHILTIEDPIEFVHRHKRCVVNQREVGPNTKSFSAALRSALREDPDIILVGEMRDLETISLALTAAETGHLVFGTLHTQSAPKTCDRIVDVFSPEQQKLVRMMFAESFQAIICQTLIRKASGTGRVCAMEIMLGTPATRSLIREGKTHQLPSIIQTSQKLGMQSLDQHLKDFFMRGIITEADAIAKANNPDFIVRGASERMETDTAAAKAALQQPPRPPRTRLGTSVMPTMDSLSPGQQQQPPRPPHSHPPAPPAPEGAPLRNPFPFLPKK
jgi:twitching motility protein PilT